MSRSGNSLNKCGMGGLSRQGDSSLQLCSRLAPGRKRSAGARRREVRRRGGAPATSWLVRGGRRRHERTSGTKAYFFKGLRRDKNGAMSRRSQEMSEERMPFKIEIFRLSAGCRDPHSLHWRR